MSQFTIIRPEDIRNLGLTGADCMKWIETSFRLKPEAILPHKVSIRAVRESDYFNTMPCMVPSLNRFSVKLVNKVTGRIPSLNSDILLYDAGGGELLAMMDGNWITTMRTGAVAVLAARLLEVPGNDVYSFMGLGNVAYATMECLIAECAGRNIRVRLLRYKDQAEAFAERFARENVEFSFADSVEELVRAGGVLFSCITYAGSLLCPDDSLYPEGILLVPVHNRGFQNCDLFFDRIFGDDREHISGFQYFDRFRHFAELGDVLTGKVPGRTDASQRIISYNLGLGLHDTVFASRIYDSLASAGLQTVDLHKDTRKLFI